MPITMEVLKRHHRGQEDLFCPRVICDECGERIADMDDGHVLYRMALPGRAPYPDEGRPSFVHKPCGQTFEARDAGTCWLWCPLDDFLIHLAANLNRTASALHRHARRMNERRIA